MWIDSVVSELVMGQYEPKCVVIITQHRLINITLYFRAIAGCGIK